MNTNFNNFNTVGIKDVLQKKPAKKDFYFYQGKYLTILNVYLYILLYL